MGLFTRKIKWSVLACISILLITLLSGCAEKKIEPLTENSDTGDVVLYLFYGDGCPHCATAKVVLQSWNARYPDLNIRSYEVWYRSENQELYLQMADKFGLPEEGRGVPVLYLGNQYWIGWSEIYEDEIETRLKDCLEGSCVDAGAGVMPGATVVQVEEPFEESSDNSLSKEITLFGASINLEHQSLFVSTLLISLVDGVNPCSIWVLSMLLALTLHTGSRKKIIAIGLIFLTVTAVIYAMFIGGLFTFLSIVNFAPWIQAVVALLALFFAIVNIKDYFYYKEGLSFTISDDKKPGIFTRIRKVMDASDNFWSMAGATILLAAGVSLVEFSCTAGFPVVWTNLLSSQNVTAGVFIALLLVYMLIYQLDELVIFFTAVFTLKTSRVEEKQGRILKLIGGMLMLALAIVMLVKPAYMNSLSGALVVFAAAGAAVLLVLLLHRRILPSFGIWIGSEGPVKRKSGKKRTTHKRYTK